jgi:hypothetical protein
MIYAWQVSFAPAAIIETVGKKQKARPKTGLFHLKGQRNEDFTNNIH